MKMTRFNLIFFSHSCHLDTLEGQDHPSDYLIRLEPHWPLQTSDRTAFCKTVWDGDNNADGGSCPLYRDLEEFQEASLCYPVGWTQQDNKVCSHINRRNGWRYIWYFRILHLQYFEAIHLMWKYKRRDYVEDTKMVIFTIR